MSRRPESDLDPVYVWIRPVGEDRRAVARWLLVRAGALLLGQPATAITVEHEPGGRPWVRAGAARMLPVSVSHSRGVVAVAASTGGAVGVDIERRSGAPLAAMARRWFDAAEVAWLRSQRAADHTEAFLLLWTAKEAVGKALGTGLRGAGLRRVMPLPTEPGPALRPLPDGSGLRVAHPAVGVDAVLAVAVAGAAADTRVIVSEVADHDRAPRSVDGSRTTLPVVVRGSAASSRSVLGRL